MIAGTVSGSVIAAFWVLAGLLLHPANWIGCWWCSVGFEEVIRTTSATSSSESSSLSTAGPTFTFPSPNLRGCPATKPENFRVLGAGLADSTVEVPSWLLLGTAGAIESVLACCVWSCCSRRASEARRRQPLGETRLQVKR